MCTGRETGSEMVLCQHDKTGLWSSQYDQAEKKLHFIKQQAFDSLSQIESFFQRVLSGPVDRLKHQQQQKRTLSKENCHKIYFNLTVQG